MKFCTSCGAEAHGTKFCVECGFKLGSGGGGDDEGGDQAGGADSGDYSGQDAHDGYSYYSDEPDGGKAPVDRAPVAGRAPRDSPARDQGSRLSRQEQAFRKHVERGRQRRAGGGSQRLRSGARRSGGGGGGGGSGRRAVTRGGYDSFGARRTLASGSVRKTQAESKPVAVSGIRDTLDAPIRRSPLDLVDNPQRAPLYRAELYGAGPAAAPDPKSNVASPGNPLAAATSRYVRHGVVPSVPVRSGASRNTSRYQSGVSTARAVSRVVEPALDPKSNYTSPDNPLNVRSAAVRRAAQPTAASVVAASTRRIVPRPTAATATVPAPPPQQAAASRRVRSFVPRPSEPLDPKSNVTSPDNPLNTHRYY